MQKRLRYLITIFWTILIFVLLTIPLPQTKDAGASYADKIVHAVLFGVFTFLIYYSLVLGVKNRKKLLFFSVLLGIFYSFLGEVLQFFIPSRTSSELDLLAGISGILISALIIYAKYEKA